MKEEEKNDGRFKKGNQLWRNIDPNSIGRNPKYEEPSDLWKDILTYFDYCDNNPIEVTETKSIKNTRSANSETKIVKHKVPYTWEGLYSFLGVCDLDHYKTKPAFSGILTHIKNIIYNQKFEGATVGVFNSAIIIRDLGLKDSKDVNVGGQKGNPVEVYKVMLPDNGRNKE